MKFVESRENRVQKIGILGIKEYSIMKLIKHSTPQNSFFHQAGKTTANCDFRLVALSSVANIFSV